MARSKRRGTKSSAQDNFIGPGCVTNLTVTNVPSGRAYNNGRIDLSWTNPTTGNTPTGYKVYRNGSLITTLSHPTNTYSDTGLTSATGYTYRVDAYDAYGTCTGTTSASVTATTVPAQPTAPTATAGVNQDTVSWSAPANGGSAITGYIWASSDGKTNASGGNPGGGATTLTSVTVAQEASTSQTYTVYAINANGNSVVSAASNSVTTQAPSFFAPPGFFSPPAFNYKSVGVSTLIRTTNGMVAAGQIAVGDQVISLNVPGLPDNFMDLHINFDHGMEFTQEQIDNAEEAISTVTNIGIHESNGAVVINSDIYSMSHWLLCKRDGVIKTILSPGILPSDLIYSYAEKDFVPVSTLEINRDVTIQVYTINVEPYDFYFTESGLSFDAYPIDWSNY